MGASGSLLMATLVCEFFIPTNADRAGNPKGDIQFRWTVVRTTRSDDRSAATRHRKSDATPPGLRRERRRASQPKRIVFVLMHGRQQRSHLLCSVDCLLYFLEWWFRSHTRFADVDEHFLYRAPLPFTPDQGGRRPTETYEQRSLGGRYDIGVELARTCGE